MAWTDAQQAAIDTLGRRLLVAAAAGSGKTAVLVERIISKILTGAWDVDRLLVVTFTHAAAEEMRQRIEAALSAKLAAESDQAKLDRLEKQLILLSGAAISTLHSFCQTIIRQNFAKLNLDPEFRVASEQELDLIKRDVLEDLFEEKYLAEDADFLRFVDAYGGNVRGDEKLYRLILQLYEFAQSQPFPDKWLKGLAELYRIPVGNGVEDTVFYAAIKQEINRALAEGLQENREAAEAVDAEGLTAYAAVIKDELNLWTSLQEKLNRGTWEDFGQAINAVKFKKLTALKGADPAQKEAAELLVKNPRRKYKDILTRLREKYFSVSEQELIEDMRQTAPFADELCRLTSDFSQAFADAKAKKRVIDFGDLEHFTLTVLSDGENDDGSLIPTAAARALQERFSAVMVDEYQDTNGVQEAIINLVTNPRTPNLFCVGDVKQSIYRFRLADPSLFLAKYREWPRDKENSQVIDLKQNFRSRPEILSAINFVFAQTMSAKATEIDYDAAAMLYPGADYPPEEDTLDCAATEFTVILPDDPSEEESEQGDASEEPAENPIDLEIEAQYIADRLKKIARSGKKIFDKEKKNYRTIEWRDIVILLRSIKGKGEKILEVLRLNNIPAYVASDAGFFREQEIKIMLALLSVIDNARQDIPLSAVLSSPIGGMDFADLAKIRLIAPTDDLYAALTKAAADSTLEPSLKAKAENFLERLSEWRVFAREKPVSELVSDLLSETGYYDYVGGLKGGLLRQANLRMLVDRAAAYEATDFRGLFRFLRFVERMQDMDTDLAVARTLGESENVVRIMSIHKSKGLEFPVVVVPDLGKKFNLQDAKSDILIHRELGLGLYLADEAEPVYTPTLARHAIEGRIAIESRAEELRVLYVALTRAREKLILVGTLKDDLAKRRREWQIEAKRHEVRLPEHKILGANSFLDWLALAITHHPDGEELLADETAAFLDYDDDSRWQVNLCAAKDIIAVSDKAAADNEAFVAALKREEPLPSTENRAEVEKLLSWQYDSRNLGEYPAKLSVTEIKRRMEEKDAPSIIEPEEDWPRPKFLQAADTGRKTKDKRLTGTEYGSLMHSVMQHIDLNGDLTVAGVKKQLEQMAVGEILREAELPLVSVDKVVKFFDSPLGKRLRRAKGYWREIPFARMVEAGRFFPEVADKDERVFVQGIIDLIFAEPGGLVLVDYKTDGDTSPDKMKERYRVQIDLYSEAVETILKQKVRERYLYMIKDGSTVAL